MPLNAAIPLSYNPTVALDMAGAKQNALVNQALMQKNMLADRQAQQDQAQQNFMNDAYGRAYDPASGQIDYNQMQALAAAGGRGGLIPGMLNQRAERDKATGEARKAQLELFNEGLKARQSLLNPNMSPEEYISWHEGNHTDPIVGPMLSQLGVKPGDSRAKIIERIKKGELPQLIAESAMGIQKLSERNTLTAEQQSMTTDRAAGRTNAAGQLAEMQRHNMATEGTQAATEARLSSNLAEPLAPKELQKREAKYPQASAAFRSSTNEIDTLVKDLKSLRGLPGLAGITGGIEGRIGSISEKSTRAQALLDKIMARGQFRELQNLRNASPTGGALGNISDKENAALRAAFAALDQSQGLKSFQQAIDDAISQAEFSKGNLQQTYDDTYSYRNAAKPSPGATSSGAKPRKTKSGVTYTVED